LKFSIYITSHTGRDQIALSRVHRGLHVISQSVLWASDKAVGFWKKPGEVSALPNGGFTVWQGSTAGKTISNTRIHGKSTFKCDQHHGHHHHHPPPTLCPGLAEQPVTTSSSSPPPPCDDHLQTPQTHSTVVFIQPIPQNSYGCLTKHDHPPTHQFHATRQASFYMVGNSHPSLTHT
jgi:hypothetical protein